MTERFLQLVGRPRFATVVTVFAVAGLCVAASGDVDSEARKEGRSASRPAVPTWKQEASDAWYEGALLGNGDVGVVAGQRAP